MSTLMEDRLAAALRARADLVRPEQLRPLDNAVVLPRRPRRRRTAVLATLAVAASAAAIAGPLLLSVPDGGAPQPAGPTEPAPTPSLGPPVGSAVHADVDGDGRTDTARIHEEGRGHLLVVSLASGDRSVLRIPAADPETPVVAGNLGGGPGDEIVLPLSADPSVLPAVYTWLEDGGVVQGRYADAPRAWPRGNPENQWWLDLAEPVLLTWHESAPEGEPVGFWEWRVDDQGVLRPGQRQLGCAVVAEVPVPCPGSPTVGAHGSGPRDPLPELMPAVDGYFVDERYDYGRDFFGPGSTDWAQLQGDFGEEGGSVEDGQVELVVTVDGVEHRGQVPAGQSPWLVPQVLAAHGDAPVFLLAQSGGDLVVNRVFSFRDGELVEVPARGGVLFGSGVVEYRGELTEQRTWITHNGELFTAVLLDFASRRNQLWRWDVGRSTTPQDLGDACIDWEAGTYRRC